MADGLRPAAEMVDVSRAALIKLNEASFNKYYHRTVDAIEDAAKKGKRNATCYDNGQWIDVAYLIVPELLKNGYKATCHSDYCKWNHTNFTWIEVSW
jgi:hypothetical protein